LFGRAAGGVALDDEQLAQGRVAFRAVRELAGQPGAHQRAFAHGVTGLAGGLAGAGGSQDFVNDFCGDGRVGFK